MRRIPKADNGKVFLPSRNTFFHKEIKVEYSDYNCKNDLKSLN